MTARRDDGGLVNARQNAIIGVCRPEASAVTCLPHRAPVEHVAPRGHEPGTTPDGTEMEVPYYTMTYDLVLTPSEEK
jgi:hypothetical protein